MTANGDEIVSADIPVRIKRRRERRSVANSKYGNGNGNGNGNGYGVYLTTAAERIERAVAEQDRTLQSTRDEVSGLKLQVGVVQRDLTQLSLNTDRAVNKVELSVETLVKRFEDNKKANPALLGLIGAVALAIPSGLVWFTNAQINYATSPISANVSVLQAQIRSAEEDIRSLREEAHASTQADATSRQDRAQTREQLNGQQVSLANLGADLRAFEARVNTQLAEAETQFDSSRQIDDVHLAHQLRMDAIFWEKLFPGTHFPEITYFPASTFRNDPEHNIKTGH